MKKILIISYFYPPCNLTASFRTLGFVKYFHKFGYSPIVVTRNWDIPIKKQIDISRPTGTQEKHEKQENSEVYYLPFHGNSRDRILNKHGEDKYVFLRKVLTLKELALETQGLRFIPYNNMYTKCCELIEQHDIKFAIISANPYAQFQFGYELKKRYPKINWIADYRDDWTTRILNTKTDLLTKILFKKNRYYEKKWLASSSFAISASDELSSRISSLVNKPVHTVYNGFFKEDHQYEKTTNKVFTITHTGYLYDSQKVEFALDGFKQVIDFFKGRVDIKIQFVGLGYHGKSADRVRNYMKDYSENLIITDRIDRESCIQKETNSELLLMVCYENLTGIPSSKLFQYLGSGNPILLAPSDNDIIEVIMKKTKNGLIANTIDEVKKETINLVEKWIKDPSGKDSIVSNEHLNEFSRENQTRILAELINKHICAE